MLPRLSQIAFQTLRPAVSLSSTVPSLSTSARASVMSSSSAPKTPPGGLKPIHTAACLIIGDEILGGKTQDTNGNYFAKYCFDLGITVRRMEVIPDEEDEIVEAVKRMSDKYDFVITSGGIGPTHDDLTYSSIAKAFNLPLKLTDEGFRRMRHLYKPNQSNADFDFDHPSDALDAKMRMLHLPIDESKPIEDQVLFPDDELWVPLSVENENVYIFPGIPALQRRMLEGIKPRIAERARLAAKGEGWHRVTVATPMFESMVAGYLNKLAQKVAPHGVKVGSYPSWGKKRNTVVLTGRDLGYLESLVPDVEEKLKGKRIWDERENPFDGDGDEP